jgi:hypothetical protein
MSVEMNGKTIETPEIDKMKAIAGDSQKIGNFIEWLSENKMEICEIRHGKRFSITGSIEKLLSKYFEIDLIKVDKEKQTILDELHKSNQKEKL